MSQNPDLSCKSNVSVENMDGLIEEMENFKIKPNIRRKRAKDTKQLTTSYNRNVDQTTELLESMAIKENTTENINSLITEKVDMLPTQDQKISELHEETKLIKSSRRLKQNTENGSTISTNEIKTIQDKHTKVLINETQGIKTRYNLRKLKEKPS